MNFVFMQFMDILLFDTSIWFAEGTEGTPAINNL